MVATKWRDLRRLRDFVREHDARLGGVIINDIGPRCYDDQLVGCRSITADRVIDVHDGISVVGWLSASIRAIRGYSLIAWEPRSNPSWLKWPGTIRGNRLKKPGDTIADCPLAGVARRHRGLRRLRRLRRPQDGPGAEFLSRLVVAGCARGTGL